MYEENDGLWLKLQGKSREEAGQPSKEMKIGIAYDGTIYQGKKPYRRVLDSKVAYASFEDAKTFRKHKEGLVASRYDVDSVELRIINGDGANWVTKSNGKGAQVHVLDEFHRNEKITTCIKDPDFGKLVRQILFEEKDIPKLLEVLEAQINSVEDEDEKTSISELLRYFEENKDALLSPYDRNIEIPETRQPGVIHHARLGSMESNVFTLVGNRMKDRRHCWSINGANNLALLICLKKTVGFTHLFENVEINAEEEWVDTGSPLSVSEALKKVGSGSEYYNCSSSTYSWMRNVMADVDVGDLNFL